MARQVVVAIFAGVLALTGTTLIDAQQTTTAAARTRSGEIPKCFIASRITHSLVDETAQISHSRACSLMISAFMSGKIPLAISCSKNSPAARTTSAL